MKYIYLIFVAAVLAVRAQEAADGEHQKRESQAARMKAKQMSAEQRQKTMQKEERLRKKVSQQMDRASKLTQKGGASKQTKPFNQALEEKRLGDAGMSEAEVQAEAQFKVLDPATDTEEEAREKAVQLEQVSGVL